jgi:hypothetical protein
VVGSVLAVLAFLGAFLFLRGSGFEKVTVTIAEKETGRVLNGTEVTAYMWKGSKRLNFVNALLGRRRWKRRKVLTDTEGRAVFHVPKNASALFAIRDLDGYVKFFDGNPPDRKDLKIDVAFHWEGRGRE